MKNIFVFLILSTLIFSFVGCKKSDSKIVIGISKIVSHPALDATEKGIQDALTNAGFTNLQYDLQNANGDISTAKQIANKFNSEKVKVAVGIATPTTQALVSTLKNIPVVFSAVTDPQGAGLVKSTTEGDEFVTGVSDMTPVEEQIKMINNIKPIKKLGNIYASNEANSVSIAKLVKDACTKLGIEVIEATVTNSSEVKQATESIIDKVDAIYISTDNTVVSALNSVTDVALKKKVPVMSADPSSAETFDIIAAYGFNYYQIGIETGKLVADILNGKKTKDLPTKYLTEASSLDLLINLDVAKQIGITVSEDILSKANKIKENGQIKVK